MGPVSHIHASQKTCRLFGLNLASDFPFVTRLTPGHEPANLSFTCTATPPADFAEDKAVFVYPRAQQQSENPSPFFLHRYEGGDLLRFAGIADFHVGPDQIVCVPWATALPEPSGFHDARIAALIEIQFLGTVLSFWLERLGIAALHASAVVVEGQAVGYLSSNHGGKSALAAALMQEGYPLLSDDILPIEPWNGDIAARPGYPTMRMWPDEAGHFLGSYESLPLVHPDLSKRRVFVGDDGFGVFCGQTIPLARLYLPDRREDIQQIMVATISPRDAVLELVRHSFTPRLVEALGWQPRRLAFFTRLAQQIPVRRLIYPSGFEHLPAVREAILEDLAHGAA